MTIQPSAFQSTKRKAAKEHKCCECDSVIQAGTEYQHSSGIWDGKPDSYKQCLNCDEIWRAVYSHSDVNEGPSFEQLREHILEDRYQPEAEFLQETAKELGIDAHKLNELLKLERVLPCGMQYGTIECRGDGYLWDADCDGYDPDDHSMPCPQCNTLAYLEDAKENAESTSSYSDMSSSGSGVDIWERSVKTAKYWNEAKTEEALKTIGKVEALYDDPEDKEDVLIRVFNY